MYKATMKHNSFDKFTKNFESLEKLIKWLTYECNAPVK